MRSAELLAEAVINVANKFNTKFRVTRRDKLKTEFPAIYAVG